MNRLWVRLSLAFMAVTLVGVATVAVLVDWQADRQFRQYLGLQQAVTQSGLLDALASHYQATGSWQDVDQVFANANLSGGAGNGPGRGGRQPLILADASGLIVFDAQAERTGSPLSTDEQASALPITLDERPVGYLLSNSAGRGNASSLTPADQAFLTQLRGTLFIAALVAGGLGMVLGLLISRTLTAPLTQLSQAARAFAAHRWEQRLKPSGTDEVVEVGRAFNEMAESIQQAETLRRNLMADISHELRTPLTVLQGNMRALLDGVYPLELGEVATLYDETRLLGRLVDDLRDLALAEAGQQNFSPHPTDLAAVLNTTVESFGVAAEAGQVILNLELAENLPSAYVDPERLEQILRNLISNALRHTSAGGRVITRARYVVSTRMLQVEVADTGEGIPADELPLVFDRFYRGDKSRSRAKGGSGLGLAIAKSWVEAMGGQISVESLVSVGSTFRFTLPIFNQHAAHSTR